MEGRKGWGKAEVEQHNRERSDDILDAGWELIIVDEAHRLGGSSTQVARYKLFKNQRKNAVAQSEEVFRSLLTKSTDKSGPMIPDFHTYLLARVE
jgi:hypothetical protein